MKKIILLVLLTLSNLSHANEAIRLDKNQRAMLNADFERSILPLVEFYGDGDVVGNGGGLLEQNFLLAYYSLQAAIENCLILEDCYTSQSNQEVLKEINQLIIKKINMKSIFIFLRNSETENFFFDEFDQSERIAKTGFSKDHPIFINLDITDEIINDVPAMLGIIVHELGHQIGIKSHSYLDQLGVKIREMWITNWIVSDISIGGEDLSLRLFSTKSNYISSKLSYVFRGKVKSLNSLILKKLNCRKGDRLSNYSLTNGHWRRPSLDNFRSIVIKTFWLDLYCEDQYGQAYLIKRDLDISFIFNSFRGRSPVLKQVEVLVK